MSQNDQPAAKADAVKDPSEWVTGAEPMTGAQESYVNTLARQAGENVPAEMTKAEASEKIDELRQKTGKARATAATRAGSKTKGMRKKKGA